MWTVFLNASIEKTTSSAVTGLPSCQCFLPQAISGGREVGRVSDPFDQQPVLGRHLVLGLLIAFRRSGDAGGYRALQAGDDDVEVVEGAERNLPERATLRTHSD